MRYADPQTLLRKWLPHVLMLAAIVASIWLLCYVVAPLFEPILLAAGLAMLTAPVLYEPIDRWAAGRFPRVNAPLRRRVSGIVATVLLGASIVTPVILVVANAVNSPRELFDLALGIATGKAEHVDHLVSLLVAEVTRLDAAFPKIDLSTIDVDGTLRDFLGASTNLSKTFLSFIASGTGAVAQMALAIIALAFFYVEGPTLARDVLHYSPLRDDQQETLLRTHRATVLKLLNDTVATAVAKGLLLGGIVWLVTRFLVGDTAADAHLPFVPVAIIAGVITLLPLVGVTVVWLPLAGVLWSSGEQVAAAVLAVACWTGNFALDRLSDRIGRRIDQGSAWRSFLLFLGLVGGLLSYGVKGLIIGPMAVVLASTVWSAWLPLYGGGSDEPTPRRDVEAETDADA